MRLSGCNGGFAALLHCGPKLLKVVYSSQADIGLVFRGIPYAFFSNSTDPCGGNRDGSILLKIRNLGVAHPIDVGGRNRLVNEGIA
jgi:hypothetical protein